MYQVRRVGACPRLIDEVLAVGDEAFKKFAFFHFDV